MTSCSRRTLTALAAATTILTAVVAAPSTGSAEESVKAQTLAKIDANLGSLEDQAGELGGQISDVSGDIEKLQKEYNALVPKLRQKERLLEDTIRESYIAGEPSSVEIIASNRTFSGAVSQSHYSEEIQIKTERASRELAAIKDQLDEKLAAAKEKRQGLLSLKGQLDERIATANAQEQARELAEAMSEAQLKKAQQENEKSQAAAIADAPSAAPSAPSQGGGGGMVRGNNPYTPGQCTWYVYNQTGRGQRGNAGQWPGGSSFGIGRILIMPPGVGGASGAGHVGIIVGSSSRGITIRDMNWAGPFVVTTHTVPRSGSYRYL